MRTGARAVARSFGSTISSDRTQFLASSLTLSQYGDGKSYRPALIAANSAALLSS